MNCKIRHFPIVCVQWEFSKKKMKINKWKIFNLYIFSLSFMYMSKNIQRQCTPNRYFCLFWYKYFFPNIQFSYHKQIDFSSCLFYLLPTHLCQSIKACKKFIEYFYEILSTICWWDGCKANNICIENAVMRIIIKEYYDFNKYLLRWISMLFMSW